MTVALREEVRADGVVVGEGDRRVVRDGRLLAPARPGQQVGAGRPVRLEQVHTGASDQGLEGGEPGARPLDAPDDACQRDVGAQ